MFEDESLALGWAMAGLALFCGSLIAGFILAEAFGVGPVNPHPAFLIMGVLSFGLSAVAPSAWWAVGLFIGLLPATLALAHWYYFAEAVALAFGPAFLGYWLVRRKGTGS
jgi:hypothetical protein